MRFLPPFFLAICAAFIVGCNKSADTVSAPVPTTDVAKPTNREAEVVGGWTLNVDATTFAPSATTQQDLDKQGVAKEALAELEKQMKDQLRDKLGGAVWTFSVDKTLVIKTKSDTATGTWSISGNDVTLTTNRPPEAKMTLSEDGKELDAKMDQPQGTITMKLSKG